MDKEELKLKNNSPIIFFEGNYNSSQIKEFKINNKISNEFEVYLIQLKELFEIRNPHLKDTDFDNSYNQYIKDHKIIDNLDILGNWIYFPWNGYFIHTVTEIEYFELRTNRNQYIIKKEEQDKLSKFNIGICGLSIGGNMAVSLSYSGISNSMKITDFDTLETCNLNRIRASIFDIGEKKIDIISKQIYDINPYANLSLYRNGLSEKNLDNFFTDDFKPNAIVDAFDDFKMKVLIRVYAKKYKVPVLMITNLADSILIDIERYDIDNEIEIFNGLIGKTADEILSSNIGEFEKVKFAIKIVDKNNLNHRILSSLFDINKNLVGRPQINSSVTIGSGLAAYIIRKLALNESLESGRYSINLDNIFNLKEAEIDAKKVILEKLENNFNL